mmetsp:Transcript_44342/g.105063  ORF Transcript_44342/g.105063 Transcript_44342/m.105063 type:complete len:228 (-) Transcript_44342:233-916(-)
MTVTLGAGAESRDQDQHVADAPDRVPLVLEEAGDADDNGAAQVRDALPDRQLLPGHQPVPLLRHHQPDRCDNHRDRHPGRDVADDSRVISAVVSAPNKAGEEERDVGQVDELQYQARDRAEHVPLDLDQLVDDWVPEVRWVSLECEYAEGRVPHVRYLLRTAVHFSDVVVDPDLAVIDHVRVPEQPVEQRLQQPLRLVDQHLHYVGVRLKQLLAPVVVRVPVRADRQ